LSVAYQRLDNDVPPPSATIDGVPPQFDRLVARATARDPQARYADAVEMGADLDAISRELGLPGFRVPAPRNSAQHRSAALHRERQVRPPIRPTRQLTLGPRDLSPPLPRPEDPYEPVAGEFAGIPIGDFVWELQHARRMVLIWVAVVLALTGLAAAAGWTIGSNLSGLF